MIDVSNFKINSNYTDDELVNCVEREIAMRESVYHHRVTAGKMSLETAKREIDMMKTIESFLIAYITLIEIADTTDKIKKSSTDTQKIAILKGCLKNIEKYKNKPIIGDQINIMSKILLIIEEYLEAVEGLNDKK